MGSNAALPSVRILGGVPHDVQLGPHDHPAMLGHRLAKQVPRTLQVAGQLIGRHPETATDWQATTRATGPSCRPVRWPFPPQPHPGRSATPRRRCRTYQTSRSVKWNRATKSTSSTSSARSRGGSARPTAAVAARRIHLQPLVGYRRGRLRHCRPWVEMRLRCSDGPPLRHGRAARTPQRPPCRGGMPCRGPWHVPVRVSAARPRGCGELWRPPCRVRLAAVRRVRHRSSRGDVVRGPGRVSAMWWAAHVRDRGAPRRRRVAR